MFWVSCQEEDEKLPQYGGKSCESALSGGDACACAVIMMVRVKMMKKMMITVWNVRLNRLCGHRRGQNGWSVRPPLSQPAAHWSDHTSSRAEVISKVCSAVPQRFMSYSRSQILVPASHHLWKNILSFRRVVFHSPSFWYTPVRVGMCQHFQRALFVAAIHLSRFVVCSCGLFLNASMTDSTSLLEELRLRQRCENAVSYNLITFTLFIFWKEPCNGSTQKVVVQFTIKRCSMEPLLHKEVWRIPSSN